MKKWLAGFSAFTLMLSCTCKNVPATGIQLPVLGCSRYSLVTTWPQLPKGFVLGNPSALAIDTAGNLVVFYRGNRTWPVLWPMPSTTIQQNTIAVIDGKTGRVIKSWGKGLFIMPHGLTVDRNNNIWITDCGLQQVMEFDYDGRLLMKIGEAGKPGRDSAHFNRPTAVAVSGDGCFYVSDGYRNSRVMKFSASGKFLFEWGAKGSAPGQFKIPHSIALDDRGNVYVADRENSRIQVFDPQGRLLSVWADKSFGKLYTVTFNRYNKTIMATDYVTNYITPKGSDVIIFNTSGKTLNRFGRSGGYTGATSRYHTAVTDSSGNIYAGDILHNTIQKFQKTAP